ncbi:MAG: L,D-transpeptidase [Prolixibacteraceae bacterium]|nr:L,D-transpeptidase [Prolixibacteraceae bacterium]MBN2773911.1 L,D-transpeptidase [Prolixibacteraceae bacterium]
MIPSGKILVYFKILISVFVGFIIIWFGFLKFIPEFREKEYSKGLKFAISENKGQLTALKLEKEVESLQKKLGRLNPGKVYLVINTAENSFQVYKNKVLDYEGICSTGSYIHLEADGDKQYLFETPKGVFTVKNKIVDPVWRKPDWAFIEEGLPIPPPTHASRYEYGVLGDYALDIGNGYLIHGTLYQRFLGLPVTHGCVRLNDADLKYVYDTMQLGSKVFIY